MSTASKFENPGVQEFVNLIKKGEMTLKPNLENMNNIMVPLCFNEEYIQTHEDTIKKFVEKGLETSEYVSFKTMIAIVDHYNVEDELEEIDVPTLILTGDRDAFIFPENSELMHRKIKNSELKIFSPKIGHYIQFEALEEYNKAIESFLKKL